jgi:hypothetical protein
VEVSRNAYKFKDVMPSEVSDNWDCTEYSECSLASVCSQDYCREEFDLLQSD